MFAFLKKKSEPPVAEQPTVVYNFNNIGAIAQFFKAETGITFEKQESILNNKVTTFCKQRMIHSYEALLEVIQKDSSLKQELIDYLTTNETYFYREFKQIEALVSLVKANKGNVNILCAPCATGEEPYSIVIALLEAGVAPYSFSIVAIDINADAIVQAQTARYKQRNVRNLSDDMLKKYFIKDEEHYLLHDHIKAMVRFECMNIFDDALQSLGTFEYIFSRNMLIYFDKETKLKAKSILESLRTNPKQEVFFGHADLF